MFIGSLEDGRADVNIVNIEIRARQTAMSHIARS